MPVRAAQRALARAGEHKRIHRWAVCFGACCATLAGLALLPAAAQADDVAQRRPSPDVVTIVDDEASAETITIDAGDGQITQPTASRTDPGLGCTGDANAMTCGWDDHRSYAVDLGGDNDGGETTSSAPTEWRCRSASPAAPATTRSRRAAGDDVLAGGDGNDTLDGRGGTDEYFGEIGDDTIKARDSLAERISCGAGNDEARQRPRRHHRRVRARRRQRCGRVLHRRRLQRREPEHLARRPGDLRQRGRRELRRARQPEPRRRRRRGPAPAGLQRQQRRGSGRRCPRSAATRWTRTATSGRSRSPTWAPRSPTSGSSRRAGRACSGSSSSARRRARAITFRCSGRSCPTRKTRRFRSKSVLKKVVLHKGFRKARLRPGTRLRVTITAAQTIGRTYTYTVARGEPPRSKIVCRAPGAKRSRSC